jgi:nucleotide-binding universal stress UspA family protein
MDTLAPGTVVVGVDGSLHSDIALTWAATYAQDHGRRLAIVHASALLVGMTTEPAGGRATRAAGEAVADAAREFVLRSHPSLTVSTCVATADPRDLLVEAAADAALVVLGSRGLGTVASLLLGSVSVALAAHAPCPVVVARPFPVSTPAPDLSVVVGVQGTAEDAEALTAAFELASAQYRPLDVIHAVGDTLVFPYPDVLGPDLVREANLDWDLLIAETLVGYAEKFPDVLVRHRLVRSSAAHALVEASARAAVVVVGSRPGAGVRHRIASVSRSVVEHARCTVLVVRGDPS